MLPRLGGLEDGLPGTRLRLLLRRALRLLGAVERLVRRERAPVVARRGVQFRLLLQYPHAHVAQRPLLAQREAVVQAGLCAVQRTESAPGGRQGQQVLGHTVGFPVAHVTVGRDRLQYRLLRVGVPAQRELDAGDRVQVVAVELAAGAVTEREHPLDHGPGRVELARLVLGVGQVVEHHDLPLRVPGGDGEPLGLPVPFPGGVERTGPAQRVGQLRHVVRAPVGWRILAEVLHGGHRVLQAGRHVPEVVVGTGQQQVAACQYRPAVPLGRPPVHRPQHPHGALGLAEPVEHVRLQQFGTAGQCRVGDRLRGTLQRHAFGQYLLDVAVPLVLEHVELGGQPLGRPAGRRRRCACRDRRPRAHVGIYRQRAAELEQNFPQLAPGRCRWSRHDERGGSAMGTGGSLDRPGRRPRRHRGRAGRAARP